MSLQSMMRSVCDHKRYERVRGRGGGIADSLTTVNSSVACDVQPASAHTVEEYATRNMHVSYSIYLATDISARETDVIVVGNQTFRVEGYTTAGLGYRQWPYRADCSEVVTG